MTTNNSHGMLAPTAALTLGLGGLIPFFAGAVGLAVAPQYEPIIAFALQLYGALILSFLGGIRWGFAVIQGGRDTWRDFTLAVSPSLVAWGAAIAGGRHGFAILSGALVAWYIVELVLPPKIFVPRWYTCLRTVLTAGAAVSLLSAALIG